MITLTKHILGDLCREHGWQIRHMPLTDFGPWAGVRLFYPGCEMERDMLYVAAEADLTSTGHLPEGASLCVLGTVLPAGLENCACTVETGDSLPAVYTVIRQYTDLLYRWDQELSELLLSSSSLQEMLDCSAPLLRNPCMFLDDHFTLMAFSGTLTAEDNPLFYETVQLGRSPNRLFEQLLSMPPQARMNYSPRNSVTVSNQLSVQGELMSNCLVDGIPVLRFFMACTVTDGPGLRDLVSHLMSRIRTSPGIQSMAKRSSGDYDMLFSRLIDNPADAGSPETMASLGLNRYNIFRIAAIDLGSQISDRSSVLAKLRVLCPLIRFFVYNDHAYALLGGIRKELDGENPLESMQRLFLHYLDELGASYGLSNDFTDLSVLASACTQAEYALNSTFHNSVRGEGNRSASYSDVMLNHMVSHFFDHFDFDVYCPSAFRAVLEDSRSGSAVDNVRLLYTYLANQCNATSTSRELHMHRNNVIYRIARLQERYNLDLEDCTQRTLLLLCCIAASHQNQ